MAVNKTANDTVIKTEDGKDMIRNELNTTKVDLGYMVEKIIVDKKTQLVSKYMMFSTPDFSKNDWFFKDKFMAIAQRIGKEPLQYPLKKAVKGDPDEGKKAIEGKAVHVSIVDDIIVIGVYTQTYGSAWKLSHTHTVEKVLFDAYVFIIKNDESVSKAEKESKSPENFSLGLG